MRNKQFKTSFVYLRKLKITVMKNLKKVKEVSVTDQFFAVMDLLQALGYETSKLTILDVSSIKHDILKTIDAAETVDLTPFMNE